MKFLIAGLGSIGRRHLRNLRSLGEQDILLYRTHHATLPDDELAGLPVETDLRAALAQKPDAVIVANPTSLHLDVALPAAEAGCAILLEKPVSHSLDRLDALQAAARHSGSRILVGFHFRHHPTLQKAVELLHGRAIGRPTSVHAHWGEYLPAWHPWEDYKQSYAARPDLGGGVTLTLNHPLDYLRWLLGEVDALWAFTGTLGDLGLSVDDTSEIGLRFAGGTIGNLHLDYNQRPASHHWEIVGTGGTLAWDNATAALRLYPAEMQEWQTFDPPEGFERNVLFINELKHFLAVCRGETQPVCTLDDGIAALRLALGALQSGRTGQRFDLKKGS